MRNRNRLIGNISRQLKRKLELCAVPAEAFEGGRHDHRRQIAVIAAIAAMALAQSEERLRVDTEGVTARILYEASIDGGHIQELKGKYKLRVTEIAIAAGGHVGHHNHLGPGIRQVTEGEMEYLLPDRTITYSRGDFFFETGDVSHRVESAGLSKHLLFEILRSDVEGASLIPPRDR